MRKLAAIGLMAFSSFASAAAGDFDLVYNVWTKHHSDSTFYTKAGGVQEYEEDNGLVGVRLGLTDNFNIGYARGVNSYGSKTNLYAAELTHQPYRYLEVGFMAGMADGYEVISSNGWTFAGGPFLRIKTAVGGATFGTFGTEAFVLTVDVPLSSVLW